MCDIREMISSRLFTNFCYNVFRVCFIFCTRLGFFCAPQHDSQLPYDSLTCAVWKNNVSKWKTHNKNEKSKLCCKNKTTRGRWSSNTRSEFSRRCSHRREDKNCAEKERENFSRYLHLKYLWAFSRVVLWVLTVTTTKMLNLLLLFYELSFISMWKFYSSTIASIVQFFLL